jgi:hypothetical protein
VNEKGLLMAAVKLAVLLRTFTFVGLLALGTTAPEQQDELDPNFLDADSDECFRLRH